MKNKKGGKAFKAGKNKQRVRELITRSAEENYAYVLSNCGNGRINIKVIKDNNSFFETQGVIRGSVRKCRFIKDDLVLVCERDYEKGVYDIIVKYTPDQTKMLEYTGKIPSINSDTLAGDIKYVLDDENYPFDINELNGDNANSDITKLADNIDNLSISDDDSADEKIPENKNKIISEDECSEDDLFESNENKVDTSKRKVTISVQKKLDVIASKGNSSKANKAIFQEQRKLRASEYGLDQIDIDSI